MVGGAAIQVPAVEFAADAGADVEEGAGFRLMEVEVGALGVEGRSWSLAAVRLRVHLQERMVILCFRHVRRAATISTTITLGMGAIACPVTGTVAIEAGVVAVRPAFTAGGAFLVPSTAIRAATVSVAVTAFGLVLLAFAGTLTTILGWSGSLLLLLEGPPLLGGVEKLAVGGLRLRRALAVLGRLEPAGHVLDGELPEVE